MKDEQIVRKVDHSERDCPSMLAKRFILAKIRGAVHDNGKNRTVPKQKGSSVFPLPLQAKKFGLV